MNKGQWERNMFHGLPDLGRRILRNRLRERLEWTGFSSPSRSLLYLALLQAKSSQGIFAISHHPIDGRRTYKKCCLDKYRGFVKCEFIYSSIRYLLIIRSNTQRQVWRVINWRVKLVESRLINLQQIIWCICHLYKYLLLAQNQQFSLHILRQPKHYVLLNLCEHTVKKQKQKLLNYTYFLMRR